MALSSSQIAEILFKKIAAGKATTQLGRNFANGEEAFSGRSFVDMTQIWAQSNLIPDEAVVVDNVVSKVNDVQLVHIPTTSSFKLMVDGKQVKNIIPFNYGDGFSYNYKLTLNDTPRTVIAPGVNDWFLDTDTGVLTFFKGDTADTNDTGSYPIGVSDTNPPRLSVWRYIGKTAKDVGFGGSSVSVGEWQNSVKSLSHVLPASPVAGQRYVLTDTLTNTMDVNNIIGSIYNPQTDFVTDNSVIAKHSIIEYRTNNDTTPKSGWVVTPASNGMFTSLDDEQNNVYFFNGTSWKKYETEKTYPREEVFGDVQDTFATTLPQLASKTTISKSATTKTDFNVYINGVKLKDNQFTFATIAVSDEANGTLVRYINNSNPSDVIWRAKAVGGNIVNPLVAPVSNNYTLSYHLHTSRAAGTAPVLGDYLMVQTDELGYELEKGANGDEICINFVATSEN
jgi:hypothetical protein